MIETDPEEKGRIQRRIVVLNRWQTFGVLVVVGCGAAAFAGGSTEGWPWLVGFLYFSFATLWVRIEYMHNRLLADIHMANTK